MTTLFGEFILEKGLLPKEQVLEALVYQIATRSSLAEIIYDHGLLGTDEQLQILSYQQYSGSDYKSSAETLGFWSLDLESKILTFQSKKGNPPLGEVLVKLGFFDMKTMTAALGEFVDYRESSRRESNRRSVLEEGAPKPEPLKIPDHDQARQWIFFVEERLGPKLVKIDANLRSSSSTVPVLDSDLADLLAELRALRAFGEDFAGFIPSGLADRAIFAVEKVSKAAWDWDKISKISAVLKLSAFLLEYLQILSIFLREYPDDSIHLEDVNLKDVHSRLDQALEDLSSAG